jgi:tripartite-type tricarboxylate transporter receptor subunit TctC
MSGVSVPFSHAATDVEFYQTHPVTIIVGAATGEAYTGYSRMIAKYLPKYISGLSNVVVVNMPGAGGLTAANHLYNVAPQDGSTIGVFSRAILKQPLLDTNGIKFDVTKFKWIGSPAQEVGVVFSWYTTPFKTIQDVQKGSMLVGAIGAGGDSQVIPFVLNSVLKTQFKVVKGYQGAGEYLLAIERGELQGSAITSWVGVLKGSRQQWIDEHKINVLLQLGQYGREELKGIPLATEMAANDSDRQLLELMLSTQTVAYPFVAPPNVPMGRFQILRDAFDAVVRDDEFLRTAAQAHMEVSPINGAEIENLISNIYASPSDVVARARDIVSTGRNAP